MTQYKKTDQEAVSRFVEILHRQNHEEMKDYLRHIQPYDLALLYHHIPASDQQILLRQLTTSQLVNLIEEVDVAAQLDIFQRIGVKESANVLNEMENDNLADLLSQLSLDKKSRLLSLMKQEESKSVTALMEYPPDTAGGLMTNRYVWIPRSFTVREAVDKLKVFAEITKHIYYFYVVDEERKLIGFLSHRDLVLADSDDLIEDLMYQRVISVPVHMDQEEVANIFQKYDLLSVPVVDEQDHLVGIVTVDDVIDVMIEEATEDIEKFAASGKDIDFHTSAFGAAKRRLPWLILLLFLGMLSGSIISFFEDTLQQVVALSFFMPMIAGMTGNTGTQSLAVIVRGLATNEPEKGIMTKVILRELRVGIMIGTICGGLVALLAYFWQGSSILGLVVGSSLFLTLIIGTLAGTIIPFILAKLKVDPAVASGPLITTLNDIFSLSVYFGTASIFISYLT